MKVIDQCNNTEQNILLTGAYFLGYTSSIFAVKIYDATKESDQVIFLRPVVWAVIANHQCIRPVLSLTLIQEDLYVLFQPFSSLLYFCNALLSIMQGSLNVKDQLCFYSCSQFMLLWSLYTMIIGFDHILLKLIAKKQLSFCLLKICPFLFMCNMYM